MRYRDPYWILDWDLKFEKGHCLNNLGSQKFELNETTRANPKSVVPKAAKRVHETFENSTFMKGVSGGDVMQGSLGWDSLSVQRELLQQIDRDDNESFYGKTYQSGSKALFFAQCRDRNETWVPLFEKVFAKAHSDYASLAVGWIGEGIEDLSGGVTTKLLTSNILDIDEFWDKEMSRVNNEFLFGASTGLLEHGYGERNGISKGHAYVVMEARTLKSGQRLVKLRNPWGGGPQVWQRLCWISYEDLIRKFSHFDRTRLFRDRDWRCCQCWIGVDVTWKAAYHEKFHIKLTQDSPLVLVVSQLDGRYFKGLQGQYSFRLDFRLHCEDSPDAEDYIVRSHGNYLMERSVSVELPVFPAGNYVVYLKVTGERHSNGQSVEQVELAGQ
ncbi:hypothetical protein FOXB_07401 [Fusarium oxysporum f. sp. conglutinans Fo5176]|uniref:Calpain catalytic domain-containing protein n=1 Tax=Fusarium oxysporum (strain Fo5176) TaxID=660025 RepID=F9FLX1_FUSOF|nr:hypothetical protein FOXB_07401 [Fusarium oxysporum f. sp. conglutinans Fo5176]